MAVDRTNFRSSNLSEGVYDSATQTLQIVFQSGATYEYTNVDPATWAALKSAPSPGAYFSRQIKNSYNFTQTG